MTDESLIGAWLGLSYVMLCLSLWIPIDLWLKAHHHETISTETRELLKSGSWEAMLFMGMLGAVLSIGLYHFFYEQS
jgi:drug/metabolite transporter (DMT)-like permease